MAIVIKKRVSLAFLGEEYSEGYLTFKALPVSEYAGLLPKFEKANRQDSIDLTTKLLKEKFIEGKFPDNGKLIDVTAEQIEEFDEATLAECLSYVTGQKLDPKV